MYRYKFVPRKTTGYGGSNLWGSTLNTGNKENSFKKTMFYQMRDTESWDLGKIVRNMADIIFI